MLHGFRYPMDWAAWSGDNSAHCRFFCGNEKIMPRGPKGEKRPADVISAPGRGLTGDKPRDHHNVTARKFRRVVVGLRMVHIDLPEPCDLVIDELLPETTESTVPLKRAQGAERGHRRAPRDRFFAQYTEIESARLRCQPKD